MTAPHRELGKIVKVDLHIEDHGMLTLDVAFDFGGSAQVLGGIALDTFSKVDGRRIGSAAGLDFVVQLLGLFKANRLSEIVGRTAYALRDSDRNHAPIQGIEIPAFDGGGVFRVDEWSERWFPKSLGGA